MDDINRCIINPIRYPREPVISRGCIFFVNPGDQKFVAEEARQAKAKKHFLFNSNLYELPGDSACFWAGPSLGAPMATMTMEKLIALGAKEIVLFGCCGSLHESLTIGDIFLPTWGRSEEGVSQHYPGKEGLPATSDYLRAQLKSFYLSRGFKLSEGPIWTTDAPFRETRDKIVSYGKEGVMAVDMELTALATVARFRGVKLAAVMLVSDELFRSDWRPGFASKSFKAMTRKVFKELAGFYDM